jgi:NAD-dependent SIR2 family protein deacetylase
MIKVISSGTIPPADGTELTKEFTISWNRVNEQAKNINFTLKYFKILPAELTAEEKKMFKEKENETGKEYSYHYGPPLYSEQVSAKKKTANILDKITVGSQERNFSEQNQNPIQIPLDALASFIANKRVLFLTGAGISYAAQVPTLQKLYKNLGISNKTLVDKFTKDLLHNPEKLEFVMKTFQKNVHNAEPTPAHHALTKLAFHLSTQIITDNYDGLHEKAGIQPYKLDSYKNLEKDLTKEVAQKIDGIICIGNSIDFKAILGRYKILNPFGVIFAINKSIPRYMRYNNFLLEGDIQKLVPLLADAVIQK